jgi:hypothetical protein
LGYNWGDESRDYAGIVYIHSGEQFYEREPDGYDDLHADGEQCFRFDNLYSHGHRDCSAIKADDHFVYGKSPEHQFWFEQHAELEYNRGDESCDYAGIVYIHSGEQFYEREPDGYDDLHADSEQCYRLEQGDGEGDDRGVWRAVDDINHVLPWGHAGRFVCGLHDCRYRGNAALHFFGGHERQLSALAGRNGFECGKRSDKQRVDWRAGKLQPGINGYGFDQRASHPSDQFCHQGEQCVPGKYIPVDFYFSPSRGRGFYKLAGGHIAGSADV